MRIKTIMFYLHRLARVKFVEDNKMISSIFLFKAEPIPLEYVSQN